MINTLMSLSVTNSITYVIASILIVLINIIQVAMFIRAILSWVNIGRNSNIIIFLHLITDPFILPVKKLFVKMNWFQRLPIDISFLVTYILLSMISTLLNATFR